MEAALLVTAFGFAVLCGFLLLFWMINALRGKRSAAGRMAATTVAMSWAVWQVYVLNPAAGGNLAHILAPIACVSVLLILSWAAKDVTSAPPSEGPDVKIPAMAMRQSTQPGIEWKADGQKKIAVGE